MSAGGPRLGHRGMGNNTSLQLPPVQDMLPACSLLEVVLIQCE